METSHKIRNGCYSISCEISRHSEANGRHTFRHACSMLMKVGEGDAGTVAPCRLLADTNLLNSNCFSLCAQAPDLDSSMRLDADNEWNARKLISFL